LFPFFCCVAIGLLHRFLYPILDPLVFVLNTFYTHDLSKYGLFQSLSQYGLFQNPGLHTCFGLNLNRVFFTKPRFLRPKSKPSLKNKELFYKKTARYPQTPCFTQRAHALAGPG